MLLCGMSSQSKLLWTIIRQIAGQVNNLEDTQ